jgi:HEAT repeat protein
MDAIEFLGAVRAKEGVLPLIEIVSDVRAREFALYALGEIRDGRAIPALIDSLSDPSENVRGNGYRALEKTTKKSFAYRYDAPSAERAAGIEKIRQWWNENSATFKVQEVTPAEAVEADSAWRRFGQQYLRDLSR